MASTNEQDLSSFMSVLIMTIGCLTILLVANTLIIASNPDNLEITSIFVADEASDEGGVGQPLFENTKKEPTYIDVHPDYLEIYPGQYHVPASDLEREGNTFQRVLTAIEAKKDRQYIVFLLRPGSALFARKLRALVRARGVDVGQELYEKDKPVDYKTALGDEGQGILEEKEPPAEAAVEDEATPDEMAAAADRAPEEANPTEP